MRKPSPLWALGDQRARLRACSSTPRCALTAWMARSRITGKRSASGRFSASSWPARISACMGAEALAPPPLDGHGLVGERAFQAGDQRGSAGRSSTLAALENHHARARGRAASGAKTIARWPAVMRSPGLQDQPGFERNVVDEGAVLAAQILHRPVVALGFEGEVLARKAGVFRESTVRRRSSGPQPFAAGKRNGFHLPVGTLDQNCARHGCELFY